MENKNGRSPLGVVVMVVSILVSVPLIVLAALQLFGVLGDAIDLTIPLIGLGMLGQACTQWNQRRKIAYFSLGLAVVSVFLFICSIVVFFIK